MEKFSAVFEQVNDWWFGYVEELPGANTQGRSLDEVRENLKETVQSIIETNRELTRRELQGKIFVQEELIVPALAESDYRLQVKRANV
jgi:predicted RNase H-like HicB family nuclease